MIDNENNSEYIDSVEDIELTMQFLDLAYSLRDSIGDAMYEVVKLRREIKDFDTYDA